MAEILILGAGVMGSAFSFPPADLGHDVRLTGTHLDREIIRQLKTNRIHPRLNMKLPDGVSFYYHDELSRALEGQVDMIVLGVSSAGVEWAAQTLGALLKKPIPVIMLTKGLAVTEDRLEILPRVVPRRLEAFGAGEFTVGAVGGPCIAGELAARRDTRVTIGWPDKSKFQWLDSLFGADYYHINYSADLTGLEICAAMKNFYALAVGLPAGLLEISEPPVNKAQMHNLTAGLFTQAVREMALLVDWMKGGRENVYGLAGVGDLYVTCQAGRNSRMGKYLGSGMTYSKAKREKMASETVEGAELALTVGPLLERLFADGILSERDYPLTRMIIDVVCHDTLTQIPWTLFDRD